MTKKGIYDIEFSDGNSLRKVYMTLYPYLDSYFEYKYTKYLRNENGEGDIIQFFVHNYESGANYDPIIICGHTGKLLHKKPEEEWLSGKFTYVDKGIKKDAFIVSDGNLPSRNNPRKEGVYNFDGETIIPFGSVTGIHIQNTNPLIITAGRIKGNQEPLEYLTLFDSEGKMYYIDDIEEVRERTSDGRIFKIDSGSGIKFFDCRCKKEIDLGYRNEDAYFLDLQVFDAIDEKGSCTYLFARAANSGALKIFKSSKNGEFLPYDSKEVSLETLKYSIIETNFIKSISHSPMKGILYGYSWGG